MMMMMMGACESGDRAGQAAAPHCISELIFIFKDLIDLLVMIPCPELVP